MKKKKLILLIVIALLVVGVGVAVYFLVNNKVTLSDKELENYLDYIPRNYMDSDSNLLFSRTKTNIDDVNNEALIGNALRLNKEVNSPKASKSVIDECILKMYNKDISKASVTGFITDGVFVYELNNNEYVINDYTNFPIYLLSIDKYKASDKELVIYTRVAQYDYRNSDEELTLLDPISNKEVTTLDTSDVDTALDYIKNNKKKFPLFKNTYKKVNDGYVWIETEK